MEAAEEAAEAEGVAWAAAMALIPEENVNSIDTVAATGRKYHSIPYRTSDLLKMSVCVFISVSVVILAKANLVSVV